jgi:apolipoprotein N-acyltransferase
LTTTSAQHSRIQTWFAARTPWQRRGIALVAGAAATLGHAPFQLTPIHIAALIVLVWLLDAISTSKSRFGSAFTQGWWFALGHFATGLYWIASAFLVDADTWGIGAGVAAVVVLAAVLGLFWGVGCLLAIGFWTTDLRRAGVFAVSLFVVEWLRGNIFTGFPWLLPGYVWTPGEPVSQLASLVGIYGLSLLTLLVAGAVATVADGQVSAGRRFAPMIGAALVLGLIFGWGAQRTGRAPINLPGSELPFVRVADSGLSQAEKWRYRPDQEWRVLQRYLEVTGTQDESRAAIVIWPEGAIPTLNFFTLDNPEFLNAIGAGLGDRVLVTGVTRCDPQPGCDAFMRGDGGLSGLSLYNSAAVIDGVSGVPRLSQTYDKYHLVPFGEYIPFWSMISQLNIAPLQRIGAGFTAGDRPTRLIIPEAPPAVVLICYEAIFPGMIPRGEDRPGWIISVTNDAWFGNGSGPYQHFAMARYRAIEEGLPMARAASGGISGIIDPYGRDVRSTHRVGAATEAQLPSALAETVYRQWGNLLLAMVLLLIAALRFAPARAGAKGDGNERRAGGQRH